MSWLVSGLLIFLGAHSIGFLAPSWRADRVARLGEYPWKGLYSVVSIVGFVLICHGFSLAREQPVVLYSTPVWLKHVAGLLMLPVFPLLFGGFLLWAVVDRMSWKWRAPQALRIAPPGPWNDAVAMILGLLTYALVVFWAHVRLFGVAPFGWTM